MKFYRFSILLLLLLFSFSCTDNISNSPGIYSYSIPNDMDDGWTISSLDEEGMDKAIIEEITSKMISGDFRGIHSFLIVKNGKIVHEAYFKDLTENDLQTIFSVTKSVSSALIGIAIENGSINSVEDTILSFFPQYSIFEPEKYNIRIKHILTLTSGLLWDEKTYPYSDPRNTETQMVATDDWMKFVLDRPVDSSPGTDYVYNTGSVHLLSGIIKKATGLFADAYTEQYLFQPLGIEQYEWNKDPQGYPCTGATLQGLKLNLRDMAKFGYLFLNNGKWNGTQIVPEEWVETSTQSHVAINDDHQFGYLWWKGSHTVNGREYSHFYAAGYGGQTIHIVPELDLMIVLTCWGEATDADIGLPILLVYSAVK